MIEQDLKLFEGMLKTLSEKSQGYYGLLDKHIEELKEQFPEKHTMFKAISSEINKAIIEKDTVKLSNLVGRINDLINGAGSTK